MFIINPYRFGGGGGASAHRYWRINQTTNHGHTSTLFVEVELRTTPGGATVTGSGTASAGGGFTGSTPANAFDGTTTAFNPGGTSGWLKYDFGAGNEKAIVEVAVKTNTASGGTNFTSAPKNFTLEWSDDDTNWTVQETCVIYAPLLDYFHTFPETPPASGYHKFWRVLCTSGNGGTFYLIDEIEFRATSGGADQVPTQTNVNGDSGGRATMGAGGTPYGAFDDSTGSWSSSGLTNQWVGFIFPTPVKVEEVLMKATTNTSRTVNTGSFDYSDDLVTWTAQKSFSGLTWTSAETKILAAI